MLRNEGSQTCVMCDGYNEIGGDNDRVQSLKNNKSARRRPRRHKHNPLDDILLTMNGALVGDGHESNAFPMGSNRSIDSMVETRPSITPTFEKEEDEKTNFECCSASSACNNFSCSIPRDSKTKQRNQERQSISNNSFGSMTSSSKVCSLSSALSTSSTSSSSKCSASLISRTSVHQTTTTTTTTPANNNSVLYSYSLPDDCEGNYCQQCSQSVSELVIADQHQQQQESYQQKILLSPQGKDRDEMEVDEDDDGDDDEEEERPGDISVEQDIQQQNLSFDASQMDRNNLSNQLEDKDHRAKVIGSKCAGGDSEHIETASNMIANQIDETRALSVVSTLISTNPQFKLLHLFKKFIAFFRRKPSARGQRSKKLKGRTTAANISSPLNWKKHFTFTPTPSSNSQQTTKNKLAGSFRYFLRARNYVPEEVAMALNSCENILPFGWYDTRDVPAATAGQQPQLSQWAPQYPRQNQRQQMLELFNRQHRYLTRILSKQKFGVSKMFQQLDARRPRPSYQFLNRLLHQGAVRNRMSGYRYNLIRPIFVDETPPPPAKQTKMEESLDILLSRLHLSHCHQPPSSAHINRLTKSDESKRASNWKMEDPRRRLGKNVSRTTEDEDWQYAASEEDCLECLISQIQRRAASRKEKSSREVKLATPVILLENIDEDIGSMICCDCAFTPNKCCGQRIVNNPQACCQEGALLGAQKVHRRHYNRQPPTATRPSRHQWTSSVYNPAAIREKIETRANRCCGDGVDNRYGHRHQEWTSREPRTRGPVTTTRCYCLACAAAPFPVNTLMVANL